MLSHGLVLFLFHLVSLAVAQPSKRDFGPVNIWVPPSGPNTPNNYTDPKTNYGRGLLLSGVRNRSKRP